LPPIKGQRLIFNNYLIPVARELSERRSERHRWCEPWSILDARFSTLDPRPSAQ
jgi:hypothetical protein